MLAPESSFMVNGKLVKSAPGKCCSYNIIYMVTCKCCGQVYIGRSVRQLNTRISEHRQKYYDLIKPNGAKVNPLDIDDDYSLGIHLAGHGYRNRNDYNEHYNVRILEICSPKNLEVK